LQFDSADEDLAEEVGPHLNDALPPHMRNIISDEDQELEK